MNKGVTLDQRKQGETPSEDSTLSCNIDGIVSANKLNQKLEAYISAIEQVALVSITDKSGKIIHVNEVFCRVSGYTAGELLGKNHRILNSGQHPKEFFVNMWREIAHGNLWHQEICNRSKSGAHYWVDSTIVPLKNIDGQIDRYLSIRVDVTAKVEREHHLQKRLKARIRLFELRREILRTNQGDVLCRLVLEKLVAAMQYPHLAFSSMLIEGKYYTSDAALSPEAQRSPALQGEIRSEKKSRGWVRVQYREPRPFLLPEEQDIVQSVAEDIALWFDRQEVEAHIRHQADHDSLTQLPNRYYLQRVLDESIKERRHGLEHFAVLFIDLDQFKVVNDSLGHETGDQMIKQVAERLIHSVRKEDIVSRQGGDEFIVLIRRVYHSDDIEAIAQKIIAQIKQPFLINHSILHIGVSIGIAMFPNDGVTADTLLRNGDAAMYQVKQTGRNGYRFFSHEINESLLEAHRLRTALYDALNKDEFELYFQPVINYHAHQQITSMEVLLRWHHADIGMVPPSKFIPLAEESGLIIPIGAWVLRTACQQIKRWQQQNIDVPRLAINLSIKQLSEERFVYDVITILQETGVKADCIILEVTESLLAEDSGPICSTHQLIDY